MIGLFCSIRLPVTKVKTACLKAPVGYATFEANVSVVGVIALETTPSTTVLAFLMIEMYLARLCATLSWSSTFSSKTASAIWAAVGMSPTAAGLAGRLSVLALMAATSVST